MNGNQIIVGLDDSPASHAAHDWAARYARSTRATLRAIHVLAWPVGLNGSVVKSGTRLRVPEQDVAVPYRRGMHRVFDDVDPPDGSVLQFAQGAVADVLVRLSEAASLLVIGTRQPTRGQRYLAGSISQYCIRFATCPVVTVPAMCTGATQGPFSADKTHQDAIVAASQQPKGNRHVE